MNPDQQQLSAQLKALYLFFIAEQYGPMANQAANQQWSPVEYLARLVEGETHRRHQRQIARRIAAARFPIIKTLDQFNWNWPRKINQAQVQNLFRLAFLKDKTNVIFIGGVGLGKTHLATALAHTACLDGQTVLFTSAIEAINSLTAAQAQSRLKAQLKKFLTPTLLVIDELGYLPIDKNGADLLFQIISSRYEKGSMLITTNQPYKNWVRIFNNDSTITSAVLDRLLHHDETVLIEGKSYRMKDQIGEP